MRYYSVKKLLAILVAGLALLPFAQAEGGADFFGVSAATPAPTPTATVSAVAVVSTPIVGVGVDLFNFDDTPQATATPAVNDIFGTETSTSATNATAEFFGVDPSTLGDTTFEPVGFTDAADDPVDTGMFEGTSISDDPFGMGNATLVNEFGVTAGTTVTGGYNPFDGSTENTPIAANSTMYVSASALKILREPQDNAQAYMTVYFGQRLTIANTQGDWASVTNNKGATGYCHLSSLSISDPNTMSKAMYTQLPSTPVYTKPDKKAPKQRYFGQNQTVTVTAITSDGLWARVTLSNGGAGFIPSIMLDDATAEQGAKVWCAAASTPIMVNPDHWTQITTLSFGQDFFLLSYLNNNTIAKIRSGKGYVAYCAASALTTTNPVTLNTPVYAQIGGKILYQRAEDTSTRTEIQKNTPFTLLGIDNTQTWALVKAKNNKYFYLPYLFLGESKVNNGSYKAVVANSSTQVFKSTAMNAEIVGTVQAGAKLYLIGCARDGIGAQVRTIADATTTEFEGYVPLKYLRDE